jgi:hypothetical protein
VILVITYQVISSLEVPVYFVPTFNPNVPHALKMEWEAQNVENVKQLMDTIFLVVLACFVLR